MECLINVSNMSCNISCCVFSSRLVPGYGTSLRAGSRMEHEKEVAYRRFSQRKLNTFAVLYGANHILNDSAVEGEAEGLQRQRTIVT